MGRLFYLVAALLRCASAASDSSQSAHQLSITVTINRVRCKRLLAANASLPVSGLPTMVCDRDYKNKISFFLRHRLR